MQPTQSTQPTQAEDSNKAFYIALAVMGLIIIGLAIAVIIVAVNKSTPPEATRNVRAESVTNMQAMTIRMDDMRRVVDAVEGYQSNNNGKTPWYRGSTDPHFVYRYIDQTCNNPEAVDGLSTYDCTGNDFRDPDMKNYAFWYLGSMSDEGGFNGDVAAKAKAWPNNHAIMVVSYAYCGDEGKTEKSYSERYVALLYLDSSGAMICMDNH